LNVKNRQLIVVALFAGLVCLAVYWRALSCGFVNYEDPEYVINNPIIRSFGSDFWYGAFATVPLNFWVPLLWVSFALDYHFWGLNPLGYHLTNNVLHAVNAGLIVFIADRVYRNSRLINPEVAPASGYRYAGLLLFAALLFGIHPARVESVAWITERKDLLNGVFTLASVYCYLRYLERQETTLPGVLLDRYYILSLLLFLGSLLAKPSSIFIPLALLVVDWYPLQRQRNSTMLRLILEKVPYLALAVPIISASVIGRAMQGGYTSLSAIPFTVRLVAAGNSILEYFRLMLFPVDILPYYHLPRPVPNLYIYKAAITYLALAALVLLARKRLPWLVAMVMAFVITLFPALHFFADGYQVILAPRYTYLASLLPVIIIAAMIFNGWSRICSWRRQAGAIFACLMAALLLTYAVTTNQLIGDWHDSGAMWSKVIASMPFEKAYFYRGEYRAGTGNYLDAVDDYTTCITLTAGLVGPKMYNVYAYRGVALMKVGYYEDALDDFTTAISMYPHPLYYYYRGTLLKQLGRQQEAAEDLKRAGQTEGPLYWIE
jgi:tetratricopeptide (TPR) repeat protein